MLQRMQVTVDLADQLHTVEDPYAAPGDSDSEDDAMDGGWESADEDDDVEGAAGSGDSDDESMSGDDS